jgi:hypothetical protein
MNGKTARPRSSSKAHAPESTRLGDLVAENVARSFVGRVKELSLLLGMLSDAGPAVAYLHGIAGIGTSRLISAFADRARLQSATVVLLDCRAVEPTENGFLRALGSHLGRTLDSANDAAGALEATGSRVVLALDHYEVLKLLDSWLRHSFVPRLPAKARLVLSDREPPSSAWALQPGWESLFRSIELDSLSAAEAASLLGHFGIPEAPAARINRIAQGHPLALALAASSLAHRDDPAFENLAIHRVIRELTHLYLAEVADPLTRLALEAACVLRRVTVSLLRAVLPEPPQEIFARLKSLPFVNIDVDGLHIHDAVKEVLATTLRAADPRKYREYRRAAWSQLRAELASAPVKDFWRYTADMLYLLENPGIRDAFFPSGGQIYRLEPARAQDSTEICAIAMRHEGAEAVECLQLWWGEWPASFSVARDRAGTIVGFYCLCESAKVPEAVLERDPVASNWANHLRQDRLAGGETALFLRRWLSATEGELPSPIQAACWLDIKRTYLALRPHLRRVYLTLRDMAPYAAVAQTLGFVPLADASVSVDGRTYSTAMLDFGPASVDGWLGRLVAAELGVNASEMLDVEARELVLEGSRIPLTRLEFEVFRYLHERENKAAGREAMIHEVWGHKYDVGSNVVDAVIKTLRKKLGKHADRIETVPGFGYKLRPLA